jgi:hypothetical protein
LSNNPDDENSLYYNSEFARGVTKIKFTLQKLFKNTSYMNFFSKGVHICRLRRIEMWVSISGVLGLPARAPLLLLILLYPSGQRIPII